MNPTLTHAPAAAPATHTADCLNCGTPLTGRYCADCGQAGATHRFTVGHLLHEIPHSIWHVDKGILFTLREMLRRPGTTLRAYLAGQRRSYFAPLSYLLLTAGISTFLLSVLHIMPFDQHDPRVTPQIRQLQDEMLAPILKYMAWYQVLGMPLLALPTWLALRRAGINYAESVIVNAFAIGTSTVINLVFIPAMYALSGTPGVVWLSWVMMPVMLGYQTWVYAQLLRGTGLSNAWRYLRGLLVSTINFGLLLLIIIGAMVAILLPRLREQVQQQRARTAQHAQPPTAPAPAPH